MVNEQAKTLLRDIEIFCDEFQISPETLLTRLKYPGLLARLKKEKHIKPITIERIYTEMELQRFKIQVKECTTLRQAVEISYKFLKGRDVNLT